MGLDGNFLRVYNDIEGKSKIVVNFIGIDFDGLVGEGIIFVCFGGVYVVCCCVGWGYMIVCCFVVICEIVWYGDCVFFWDVIMCFKSDMCCLVEMGIGYWNINFIFGWFEGKLEWEVYFL